MNVTPKRQQMTEELMTLRATVDRVQALWEDAESAFEAIEAQSRHFRQTRRLVRRARPAIRGQEKAA